MLKKRLGIEAIEVDWISAIFDYYKIPSSLIIPDGCRKVGECAFVGCIWLRNITIPGSVKEIGDKSFCGCKKLGEVVIPENVEVIGKSAFYGCEKAVVILNKPQEEFKLLESYSLTGCLKIVNYVKEEVRK